MSEHDDRYIFMQGPGFPELPGLRPSFNGLPDSPAGDTSVDGEPSAPPPPPPPHENDPLYNFSDASIIMAAEYMASRGPEGMEDLYKLAAKPATRRLLGMVKVHLPAANNHSDTIAWLLDVMDASVMARDEWGCTALHHATVWDRMDAAFALLARGGDGLLEAENRMGKRASQWVPPHASIRNHVTEVLNEMESAGGFWAWCRARPFDRLVLKHVPRVAVELSYDLLVLRVQVSRAASAAERLQSPDAAFDEPALCAGPELSEDEMASRGLTGSALAKYLRKREARLDKERARRQRRVEAARWVLSADTPDLIFAAVLRYLY